MSKFKCWFPRKEPKYSGEFYARNPEDALRQLIAHEIGKLGFLEYNSKKFRNTSKSRGVLFSTIGEDWDCVELKKTRESFKEFLESQKYGYVSAGLKDSETLKMFLENSNIGNTVLINKLHVTLMYDRSNSVSTEARSDAVFKAEITDVKRLGEPGSKWEAVVLVLKSPVLDERHEELKKLGFKHSYSEYIAHMSVKYKPEKDDLEILKKELKNIKGKIITLKENKWEQINE